MVGDEELVNELEEMAIPIPNEDTLDKLRELCAAYRLAASEIVEEWVAYQITKTNVELKREVLETFERERLFKRGSKPTRTKTPSSQHSSTITIYDSTTIEDGIEQDEEDLLGAYGTPSAKNLSAQKKRQLTPDAASNKRLTAISRSPVVPFSPGSFSPASTKITPSQKFSSRTNAGEVLCNLGDCSKVMWRRREGATAQIKPYDTETHLTKQFRYMFQKLSDKAHVLNDLIDEIGAKLQKHHNIAELGHVALPVQEETTVIGRICCDSNGKLNNKSVMLEGSRESSSGKRIPLDLSCVHNYSMFPGQVVALSGVNSTGNSFVAKKMYENVPLPLPEPSQSSHTEPMSVLVACGPFTTSDSLAYEPLSDLVKRIQIETPDVCILLGPFLDAKFPDLEAVINGENKTFQEMFTGVIGNLISALRRLKLQLVLVPSWRDVHHDYVYPQPPFNIQLSADDQKWVHLVADPCTLTINDTVVGITSTDILFHLGAEEISSPPGGADRLARLTKHVLTQHNYYPLCPPSEDVNVDYDHYELYAKMPVRPHILILPSDLRYFIKEVCECCCVNPGRLAKGQVGGTYARLLVTPGGANTKAPSILGQVLRI